MTLVGLGLLVVAFVLYALDFFGVLFGAAGIANLALVGAITLLAVAAWVLPLYRGHHRTT